MNREQAKSLVGKTIKFKERIEDQEAYPDNLMYARILEVREDIHDDDPKGLPEEEQVWEIKFSYIGFEQYNERVEKCNWYVYKNGVNTGLGSAKQAGYYKDVEEIYFPGPKFWEEYFDVIDADPDGWMPIDCAPDNAEPVLVYPTPTWQGDNGHAVAWYSKSILKWVYGGAEDINPKFWKPLTVPVAALRGDVK